jgi:hypothetical protein
LATIDPPPDLRGGNNLRDNSQQRSGNRPDTSIQRYIYHYTFKIKLLADAG